MRSRRGTRREYNHSIRGSTNAGNACFRPVALVQVQCDSCYCMVCCSMTQRLPTPPTIMLDRACRVCCNHFLRRVLGYTSDAITTPATRDLRNSVAAWRKARFRSLVLNLGPHLASGMFGTPHSKAQMNSKQFYSYGMKRSLNQEFCNFAHCVSVNGLVVSGAWSGRSGLEHAQTQTEQGLLRTLNIRSQPCQARKFALISIVHNIRDSMNIFV